MEETGVPGENRETLIPIKYSLLCFIKCHTRLVLYCLAIEMSE
jgi:hypothetical protein